MAVDEMLLERTAEGAGFQLRFYQWEEPTLSLGYFQPLSDRAEHAASRDCPVVRRLSGGGTILHDRELTYSLTVPARHPLAVDAHKLYLSVHESLVEALASFGVTAVLRTSVGDGPDPFLCFARRSVGDVLVSGTKIAGSAERRRRGVILQHGSVLLETSSFAPELLGIDALTGKKIMPSDLTGAWLESIARRMDFAWQRDALTDDELARARELEAQKFATTAWNAKR